MKKKTLGYLWKQICEKYSQNVMIYDVSQSKKCTYRQFLVDVDCIAKRLIAIGVKRGEHIGLLAGNSMEWLKIFAAVTEIGGVITMFNTSLSKEQLLLNIQFSDVTYLFTDKGMIEQLGNVKKYMNDNCCIGRRKADYILKEIFVIDSDNNMRFFDKMGCSVCVEYELEIRKKEVSEIDIAAILFSSGTTGEPKAVQLSHKSIVTDELRNAVYFSYSNKDKMLLTTPLFHVLGFTACILPVFIRGASLYLIHKYSTVKVWEVLKKEKCTAICGVPTIYQFLCDKCNPGDTFQLRFGLVAGALCPTALIQTIFLKLGIERLENYYGQSETITIGTASYFAKDIGKEKGFKVVDGIKYKILASESSKKLKMDTSGELIIRSETAFSGYYKNDLLTKKKIQNGWIYTGDVACEGSDGTFYIKGRLDDVIIRGGENISAVEVEEQLIQHPFIKAASVIGVPDKLYGQDICAFIVLKENRRLSIEELKQYFWNKAGFKIPKYIQFVKEFPHTASGKVKKYELLKVFEANEN